MELQDGIPALLVQAAHLMGQTVTNVSVPTAHEIISAGCYITVHGRNAVEISSLIFQLWP